MGMEWEKSLMLRKAYFVLVCTLSLWYICTHSTSYHTSHGIIYKTNLLTHKTYVASPHKDWEEIEDEKSIKESNFLKEFEEFERQTAGAYDDSLKELPKDN